MKYIFKLLLLLCTLFHCIESSESYITPENSFLAFDIDEVLVKKSWIQKPTIIFGGCWYKPLNSYNWILSLLKIYKSYKKDINGDREKLYDDENYAINGLTFHLLYNGLKDKNFASYIMWMLYTLESTRIPNDGIIELCDYLKDHKGYSIVFATNKDHIEYNIFAQTSGKILTHLPEKVFVAHPGNNRKFIQKLKNFALQKDVPNSYKQILYKTLTIQPTSHIRHVPTAKPNPSYYEYVYKTIKQEDNKKNMIFIDDKKENIDGLRKYSNNANDDVKMVGIQFQNSYQLAQELVSLGILSSEIDKEILQKMEHYK